MAEVFSRPSACMFGQGSAEYSGVHWELLEQGFAHPTYMTMSSEYRMYGLSNILQQ